MKAVALLLAALLAAATLPAARAANFETTTVDGELRVTSEWSGGFCGELVTRNPGTNPSTSWAGLFTFSGGTLTSDPQGNGVAKRLRKDKWTGEQWTFTPTDPAQMQIFSESPVTVSFCADADKIDDVQVTFRVIFSYDYRGVGYNPPPPSPPPPSPPSPPPPRAPAPAGAPDLDISSLVSGGPDLPDDFNGDEDPKKNGGKKEKSDKKKDGSKKADKKADDKKQKKDN